MKDTKKPALSVEEIAKEIKEGAARSAFATQQMYAAERVLGNILIKNQDAIIAFYEKHDISDEKRAEIINHLANNKKHVEKQYAEWKATNPSLSDDEFDLVSDSVRIEFSKFQDFINNAGMDIEYQGKSLIDISLDSKIKTEAVLNVQSNQDELIGLIQRTSGEYPERGIDPISSRSTQEEIEKELKKFPPEVISELSQKITYQGKQPILHDELGPTESKLASNKIVMSDLLKEQQQIQEEITKISDDIEKNAQKAVEIEKQIEESIAKTTDKLEELENTRPTITILDRDLKDIELSITEAKKTKESQQKILEERKRSFIGRVSTLFGVNANTLKNQKLALELEQRIKELEGKKSQIESDKTQTEQKINQLEQESQNLKSEQLQLSEQKISIANIEQQLSAKKIELEKKGNNVNNEISKIGQELDKSYKALLSPDMLSAKVSQEILRIRDIVKQEIEQKSTIETQKQTKAEQDRRNSIINDFEEKFASAGIEEKIKACLEATKKGQDFLSSHILNNLRISEEIDGIDLEPHQKAFVRAMSFNSITSDNSRDSSRGSFSSISDRSSQSSLSSTSTRSSFPESYGSRKGAKQGGANASKDNDAGIYKNDQGETFLIKSDEDKPQKDIGEYLTAVVYQSLAPNHGAQVDLVRHEDGRVFLASKFVDGYKDFHKVFGDETRARVGETVSALVKKQDERAVYQELDKAITGGEYTGYPEAMAPAMIAGEFARHSGNFGAVDNGDGTKKLVSIDFGAAARAEHFGPTIELDVHLPDKTIIPGVDMGEKNYYKKDHPQELLYTEEFATNADKMSKIDISSALEAAWLNVEQSFPDDTIKAFGKQMGMSQEDLSAQDFKDKIRDHYIGTIKQRQQSLGEQFGTKTREANLNDPNFKVNGEQLQDALHKKQYKTNSAKKRSKKALEEALKSKGEVDVDAICKASGSSKHPENLKRINSLIDEMAKDPKIKKDASIRLVEIKNRICVEHINAQMKIGKLTPDSPELKELAQNMQGLKGDVNDKEIKAVLNKLPDEFARVVLSKISKNADLKLDPKERLIEEGAYKLYSEGYRNISIKAEGATPGFMCKDPDGKMCIVKTGPKGREESESIAELFACKLGQAIFQEAEKMGAPPGISQGIPDVSLVNLQQNSQTFSSDKGYVKSVFFKDFSEVFREMGEKERPKLFTSGAAEEYCRGLQEKKPEQFQELSWYLAFRHVIRDLDGHSANFGVMKRDDGTVHMSLIDAGLAGRNLAKNPMIAGDLTDKRVISGKLAGEASPNHLSDWGEVYKGEEFKKACEVLKDIFEKNPDLVKASMQSSLESAQASFGDASVKKYCSEWIGIKTDAKVDIADAATKIFDLHKDRAVKLDEIASGKKQSKSSGAVEQKYAAKVGSRTFSGSFTDKVSTKKQELKKIDSHTAAIQDQNQKSSTNEVRL
jgi:hypothetical protein